MMYSIARLIFRLNFWLFPNSIGRKAYHSADYYVLTAELIRELFAPEEAEELLQRLDNMMLLAVLEGRHV